MICIQFMQAIIIRNSQTHKGCEDKAMDVTEFVQKYR